MGGTHPKIFFIFCGHVIYQMKGLENPYSEMPISCPFDRQQLKITLFVKMFLGYLNIWESIHRYFGVEKPFLEIVMRSGIIQAYLGLKLPENGLKYFSLRYVHIVYIDM